jgi:hypothetical protein
MRCRTSLRTHVSATDPSRPPLACPCACHPSLRAALVGPFFRDLEAWELARVDVGGHARRIVPALVLSILVSGGAAVDAGRIRVCMGGQTSVSRGYWRSSAGSAERRE